MTSLADDLFGVGTFERGLDVVQTFPSQALGRGAFAVDVQMQRYVVAFGTARVGLAWSAAGTPVAVAAQLVEVGPGGVARFEVGEVLGDLQVWTTDPEDVASAVTRSVSSSRNAATERGSVDPVTEQIGKLVTGAAVALVVYAAVRAVVR
jgi:hypothetical protein